MLKGNPWCWYEKRFRVWHISSYSLVFPCTLMYTHIHPYTPCTPMYTNVLPYTPLYFKKILKYMKCRFFPLADDASSLIIKPFQDSFFRSASFLTLIVKNEYIFIPMIFHLRKNNKTQRKQTVFIYEILLKHVKWQEQTCNGAFYEYIW
jgi:hypothetical protein